MNVTVTKPNSVAPVGVTIRGVAEVAGHLLQGKWVVPDVGEYTVIIPKVVCGTPQGRKSKKKAVK